MRCPGDAGRWEGTDKHEADVAVACSPWARHAGRPPARRTRKTTRSRRNEGRSDLKREEREKRERGMDWFQILYENLSVFSRRAANMATSSSVGSRSSLGLRDATEAPPFDVLRR
ncbi:hypothetical protein VTK73DRAFT_2678 [Phialemonium thermophilum]|uniref:Uncharacterized protein n=1 Tax=Phialemonium thermophilum TaxID=223376 RepID=A0ABR3VR60_9PEZI